MYKSQLYKRAAAGETVFYDIYTDAEKADDPAKEDTGLFFFKGAPGEKFAICNAGGGFASVSYTHLARPVAAVDINAQALQHARRFLNLPEERCYLDLQKALHEVEADFVNIVVPPQMHESVIDIAIAHGLDVVCEKPLGGDMAACVRIYNKVKSSGRKLAVTMSHRLEVEKQTVQSMVESGK